MRFSRRTALQMLSSTVAAPFLPGSAAAAPPRWSAPGEFEPQEYIWLSWKEQGFLGSAPFSSVATEMMRILTPEVKVRLLYSNERPPYSFGKYRARTVAPDKAAADIRAKLARAGIDVSRVELVFYPKSFGAIQDPGPFFLRSSDGRLALADYRYDHPDPRSEAMDRALAVQLGLPTVSSKLVSEGGGRQSNGRGTLLLVKTVELARNPGWTLNAIEREHLRVHGAKKAIWLEQGPADEEWGRLKDGRYGIGTGGHVDVFARFADPSTVLLAEVSPAQRDAHPIAAETYARMERNRDILLKATDQDGSRLRVVTVPVPDPLTATYSYNEMTAEEKAWFEGAREGEQIEFYLPAGYLNFIIANGVVLTAKLGGNGRPQSFSAADRLANKALSAAFPNRKVVQIDVEPLLRDGAGLHCHSRNQPAIAG
jgi:agmatine deiminase